MNTEVRVVRIYCSEANAQHHTLLKLLHEQERVAGVTAFRGIAGFGGSGHLHQAGLLDAGMDLPIVIEFFDRPAKVAAVIQHLNEIVEPGHMLSWPAQANLD